jgi:hypothetical protein
MERARSGVCVAVGDLPRLNARRTRRARRDLRLRPLYTRRTHTDTHSAQPPASSASIAPTRMTMSGLWSSRV